MELSGVGRSRNLPASESSGVGRSRSLSKLAVVGVGRGRSVWGQETDHARMLSQNIVVVTKLQRPVYEVHAQSFSSSLGQSNKRKQLKIFNAGPTLIVSMHLRATSIIVWLTPVDSDSKRLLLRTTPTLDDSDSGRFLLQTTPTPTADDFDSRWN